MNTAERVVSISIPPRLLCIGLISYFNSSQAFYSHLTPEGAISTPDDPPASWPERGVVEFKDVHLRYRAGLPEVLKGVSFNTKPGEKVRDLSVFTA